MMGETKLVPVEPTDDMVKAGCEANMRPPHQSDGSVSVRAQTLHIYRTMLAAAPLPSSDKPSDAELVKRLTDVHDVLARLHPAMHLPGTLEVFEATKTVLRLAASRLSVPREGEWLPIETAVKDTKARLVWCPAFRNTYVVGWVTPYGEPVEKGFWSHFGGGNRALSETPTLWQPLPKSPA